jgi:thiol-disulfide isomerase/thioredoxin
MKHTARVALAAALALPACARKGDTSTPLPPPAASHADAPDGGDVGITGRLLAHDGSALRRAEVSIGRAGFLEPTARHALDADGRFRVSLPAGVYDISIAAVDHRAVSRRVLVTDELRVEGRMGTYARTDPGPALTIRAEYLDGEGKVVGPGPSAASRVSKDVYRLALPERPPHATRLRYQLVAPTGRTSNGPLADDYESDGGGDFWSLVDVSAKDALELDLGALPPAGQPPQLLWSGEGANATAVVDVQERWYEAIREVLDRAPREDGMPSMTEGLLAEMTALAAKAREEVDAVTDPTLHALLRVTHLSVFTLFLRTAEDAKAVEAEIGWLVDHVSPTDPHLGLLVNLDNVMHVAHAGGSDAFIARTHAWLEQQAREHPEPGVAIGALGLLVQVALRRGDHARVKQLYALVLDARFEGAVDRMLIEQRYDPNRVLQPGKPFPAFDFAGLRDSEPRVTSTERAGTLYLLEFWATWCGPCVAEMPKLHAAYAAINGAKPAKGRGDAGLRRLRGAKHPKVEFVFLSLDATPAEVEAFRRERWSMPWIHGFVGLSSEQEVKQRYGFSAVPTMVLVDESGTILEVDGGLRVDLLGTLERVVAERSATRPSRPSSPSARGDGG